MDKNSRLEMFYYGDFSFDKILKLKDYPNIHIYSKHFWPVSNFVGIVDDEDLVQIRKMYKQEVTIE